MNKNDNGTALSLESQGLSVQPQAIICPKCQHKRTANDPGPEWQCPNCGIAYNKAAPQSESLVRPVSGGTGARTRRDADRDVFDTATPSAISLSLTGRIGRLRYLAYFCPTMLLSIFLILLAVRPGTVDKTSTIVLAVVLMGLWVCVSLRLMALRMHDLNQSSKWLLGLIFLPGVFMAFGKPQLAGMFSILFWIAGLMLMLVPGTDGDNNYGEPPAPNTTLVKVGAGIYIFFIVFGVIANVRYMQYVRAGKLHSPLASATQEQSDSAGAADAASALQSAARTPYPDWVGLWQGPHSSLQVNNLGNALFVHNDGSFSVRASGPLQILDENRISIGAGPNAVILKLGMPPHAEGQSMKMLLDGVELSKGR